jgi:hypothetical protein
MDVASEHEAYLNGGLKAIDEMHDAGLLDSRTQRAWQNIASGEPARIEQGNADLAWHEQNQVIVPG